MPGAAQPETTIGPDVATTAATERPDADRDLVVLLSKSLRLLGEAGRPDAANRLAAKAWWALTETDPKGAQRINGVMHYLARLPEADATASGGTPPETSDDGANDG